MAESNIILLDSDDECECTTPLAAKEKTPAAAAAATQEKGNKHKRNYAIDHEGKL